MRLGSVLAAFLGLLVVAGVVAFGWRSLEAGSEPEADPREDAARTAEEYVDAWNAGDLPAMTALVDDPPQDFVPRHEQLVDGTGATALEVVAGEVEHPSDGRALVPLTVRLSAREISEPILWRSELALERARGRWSVQWTISTLHPEMRPTWEFAREREDVGRRDILAVDGTPLAGAGEVITFGFQPALVEDADEVIEAFADALPGSESTAERELSRDDLNDDWFYPVVSVSSSRADEVAPRLREATGILRQADGEARALYDDGFAQHTVGIVREATAEQLANLGDLYEAGDEIGQYGLEAVFEQQLVGTEVIRVGLVDPDVGEMRHTLGEGQERASQDVRTTIDVDVQRAVERTLENVQTPAGIVVVDSADGAIRGTASRPLSGYHRAFSGRYPPGSTFKIVTAEAALAEGYGLEDEVECPGETVVGGLRVPNSADRDLGTITFAESFAESCNTTFGRIGAELGADALTAAANRFGFDADWSLPLDTFPASFPEPRDTAEVAAASFGQARVQASVTHMASVAAAVEAGAWHQPYLIIDEETEAGPLDRRPLAAGTAEPLRRLLETAVVDGTGDAADVDGRVGGKTGTAQGADGVEHAWFVGVFEGLGFAILLEDGGSGGEVAAPLAGRLVTELSTLRASSSDDGDGDGDDASDPDDGDGADAEDEDGA